MLTIGVKYGLSIPGPMVCSSSTGRTGWRCCSVQVHSAMAVARDEWRGNCNGCGASFGSKMYLIARGRRPTWGRARSRSAEESPSAGDQRSSCITGWRWMSAGDYQ